MDSTATDKDPSTAPEQESKAHLLTIPPELRNDIFYLAFINQDAQGQVRPISIPTLKAFSQRVFRPLHINRQIREDFKPVFYANNTFSFQQVHRAYCAGKTASSRCCTHVTDAYDRQSMLPLRVEDTHVAVYSEHQLALGKQTARFLMMLPPNDLCARMRKIKIKLSPPLPWCVRESWDFQSQAIDWLYPLRHLEEFGFQKLASVHVYILVPREAFVASGNRHVEDLLAMKSWVKSEMDEIDALGGTVEITFEEET